MSLATGTRLGPYEILGADAIRVTPVATFQFQHLEPLFSLRSPENFRDVNSDYFVFPGGQKFLINKLVTSKTNVPVTVTTNWTDALKQR